jgi:hypothetical protein
MHRVSAGADIDAHQHDRPTTRPDDFALQAPSDTGLIEDLQTIRGPVDMEMEALAAAVAHKIEEKSGSQVGGWAGGTTPKQASEEAEHRHLSVLAGW